MGSCVLKTGYPVAGPDALEGLGFLERDFGEENYRFTSFMIARF